MVGKVLTSAVIFPIVCFLSFYITYLVINQNSAISDVVVDQALNTDPTRSLTQQIINNSVFSLKDDLNIFSNNTIPDNAKKYLISPSSSVEYVATKTLLISSSEEARGKTNSIIGGGWFDETGHKHYLKSQINILDIKSTEPDRDKAILPIFSSNFATVEIFGPTDPEYKLVINKTFDTIFEGKITINNVTKPVWLAAKGKVTESDFEVNGYAVLKLSDFNIGTLKMSNIFVVEDELRVEFNVYGLRY